MSEENELKLKEKQKNPYSKKYRIFKTILMIYAWISFGINLELIGVALEDLKLLLDVPYQLISISLVLRSASYMIVTVFIGFIIDRLSNYSEFIMVLAKFLVILPNFLIPWIKIYGLSMSLFLLQGVGHAIYDVCGNQIIFRLWSGISESPVNAMHAGYGIGAMITVQLLKPYLKYNPSSQSDLNDTLSINDTSFVTAKTIVSPYNLTDLNNTNRITPDDIKLQIPYSIAGCVGILTMILFLIAQFFEFKQIKKFNERKKAEEVPLKGVTEISNENYEKNILEKVFDRPVRSFKTGTILLTQLGVVFLLFMVAQGYNMVLSSFMLTYTTKGPAKLSRDEFLTIQTFFWISFIIGRFSAALVGFKLNSLYFFTILIYLNTFVVILFNTKLNMMKSFYWIILLALGFTNGPLIPSCFALAKFIFVKLNAFFVSLFCIGLGIGSLISNYTTGWILDKFHPTSPWFGYEDANSSYAIPLILISISAFGALVTIIALVLGLFFKDVFSGKYDENRRK